jgi:hypothetical protein
MSHVPQTSTGVSQKFPPQQQQQQQTNMFPTQQFPPTSNPFVQQPFGASKINNKSTKNQYLFLDTSNFFGMPPTNQPNPFMV